MTGNDRDDQASDAGAQAGRLSGSARVEAFSDGVLAIAITLLVLDLRVPGQGSEMRQQLLSEWPAYLAYLASFAYIGVIWINHHQLFTRIAAVDQGLLWCNLGLLLGVSVLPFPTAVLSSAFRDSSRSSELTASVLYAIVAGLMGLSWLLPFRYLSNHPQLLDGHTPAAFFAQERLRAALGLVAYLIAAAMALWQPLASLVIFCLLPVFYGATSEGWNGKRKRRALTSR